LATKQINEKELELLRFFFLLSFISSVFRDLKEHDKDSNLRNSSQITST